MSDTKLQRNVKLSKSITQVDTTGREVSTMKIEVEYDPIHDTVESIKDVIIIDEKKMTACSIKHIMSDYFDTALHQIVGSIDWEAINSGTEEHPLTQKISKTIKEFGKV